MFRSMSPRIREASRHFEEARRQEDKLVEAGGREDIYSEYRTSLSRTSSLTSDEGVIIGNYSVGMRKLWNVGI